ncbi:RNA polymerase subunit sigma-70 [Rhodococcus sp. RD6.2]|jgi:anti-sigma factor RsiW|uniref:RNA polymerase subunit sigma-70 n=1 Tax=Rhodococcus sp. RD6.2 TaxID=260936 RepID=UPI0006798A97|nr:RNA polymerase subunit sigma-70 [Rhodococcus sp. RD6.2]
MTQGRGPRRFGSTEHLASEAVAAYVDGELQMNAYLRASQHLSECAECAAAVDAQQHARVALRQSGEITMPVSLLGVLSRIPTCQPADEPAADAARTRRRAGFTASSYSLPTWRRRR